MEPQDKIFRNVWIDLSIRLLHVVTRGCAPAWLARWHLTIDKAIYNSLHGRGSHTHRNHCVSYRRIKPMKDDDDDYENGHKHTQHLRMSSGLMHVGKMGTRRLVEFLPLKSGSRSYKAKKDTRLLRFCCWSILPRDRERGRGAEPIWKWYFWAFPRMVFVRPSGGAQSEAL